MNLVKDLDLETLEQEGMSEWLEHKQLMINALEVYYKEGPTDNYTSLTGKYAGFGKVIEGYDVLVVDDITDSALTMDFVIKHLKEKNPNSIKSCVLLDKPSRRKVELVPDYCGFTIEDKFVVGYGLNFGDHYRNIPYVFAVTDEDR